MSPISQNLVNMGNLTFSRAFPGNLPETMPPKMPHSWEDENTHAASLCVRGGGGGGVHCDFFMITIYVTHAQKYCSLLITFFTFVRSWLRSDKPPDHNGTDQAFSRKTCLGPRYRDNRECCRDDRNADHRRTPAGKLRLGRSPLRSRSCQLSSDDHRSGYTRTRTLTEIAEQDSRSRRSGVALRWHEWYQYYWALEQTLCGTCKLWEVCQIIEKEAGTTTDQFVDEEENESTRWRKHRDSFRRRVVLEGKLPDAPHLWRGFLDIKVQRSRQRFFGRQRT